MIKSHFGKTTLQGPEMLIVADSMCVLKSVLHCIKSGEFDDTSVEQFCEFIEKAFQLEGYVIDLKIVGECDPETESEKAKEDLLSGLAKCFIDVLKKMDEKEEDPDDGGDDDETEEPDGMVETPAGLYRWLRSQCGGRDESLHDEPGSLGD